VTKGLVLAAVMAAGMKNHAGLDRPATEADLLRAYALGECLAKTAEKTPFAEDAQRSADLYLQGGRIGGAAYGEIRKTVPMDLLKLTSYEGKTVAVFRCIEWYESPKLKALAQKLASTAGKAPSGRP
jgi:hypothetical protein